jgi:anti-anti-sigma factor
MSNNDIISRFDDEKDESLKIHLQKVDLEGGLVVGLNGYIDTYNTNFFQTQVQRVIEEGFIRLIFNCSGLNYVSSTGIGSFTTFLKAVKPQGGDVVLLELQPKVYEVFQLLGFSQYFNTQGSLDSAIEFFHGDNTEQEPEIFPKTFPCPLCSKNLKAVKPGRFRCSECKTILTIDNEGTVSLG